MGYSPLQCKESDRTERLIQLLLTHLGLLLRSADTGAAVCVQEEALELGVPRARGEEGIERTKASHASSGLAKDQTPTRPLHPGIKGHLHMTLKGMVFLALPAASPLQLPSRHRPWNLPLQAQRATYLHQILRPHV